MKGDFSRITFDAANHFSRVLTQQGRVTLDADSNEQAAILLHYVRTLARDLIGPYGGPEDALGFKLEIAPPSGTSPKPWTLNIGPGRYYVDGILCENDAACSYAKQPDHTPASTDPLLIELGKPASSEAFWLYLDVWERHITSIEDERMREVALGGPDTCTRTKVVWQVKALARTPPEDMTAPDVCTSPLDQLTATPSGQMAAELDRGKQIKDPCVIAPDARYRGTENQLYRVEIHRGNADGMTPTFKWSRDNGSVASAWLGAAGHDLIVASARGFHVGAWVELSDDAKDLRGEAGVLVKVISVDGNRLSIDPESVPESTSLAWTASLQNPKVRQWDQTQNEDITLDQGAIPIPETTTWIDLEDGVRVQFSPAPSPESPNTSQYRTGDYWLIPARVATGDIEWPRTGSTADFLPPRGIEHHYAPLGWLIWSSDKWEATSCLRELNKLTTLEGAPTPLSPSISTPTRSRRSQPASPQPASPQPASPQPASPQPGGPGGSR
ncbi:MAG TPA: DUF6519 domain-containing protein [Kofleriaceae bacterium]|nr:DUF6519 domain-containing protein [Kofleriaceae bacterium]